MPVDRFLAALLVVAALVLGWDAGPTRYDDAYITFRYARNLATGDGLAFQPGDSHLGTTAPAFALLLAGLGRLTSPARIPQLAEAANLAALAGLALALFRLGAGRGERVAGLVAALGALANPVLVRFWGGESIPLLALVAAAVLAWDRRRPLAAGVLVGLAALTRGEGLLLAPIFALAALARWRRDLVRLAAGLGVVLGPWTVVALAVWGSPWPATLAAKSAQGASGLWGPFLPLALDWLRAMVVGSHRFPGEEPRLAYLVAAAAALAGLVELLRRPRFRWLAPLAWVAAYALGYAWIGAPFYYWYACPLVLAAVVLAGAGGEAVWRWVRARVAPGGRRVAAAALALAALWPLATGVCQMQALGAAPLPPALRQYESAGRWLAARTPPEATVGAFEIGVLGWHSGRRFVDPTGLLDPGLAPAVAAGEFKEVYRSRRPDYVVVNPRRWYAWLGSVREEPWFVAVYELAATVGEPGYDDSPLSIYRRRALPAAVDVLE